MMSQNIILSMINLSGNVLTPIFSEILNRGVLENKGFLTTLDLTNTKLDSKCFEFMKDIFVSSKIVYLNLSQNPI